MGVVAKQGSRNAITIFLGFGLGGLITLFGPRVFESDPSQWGLIQILVSYSSLASLLVTFGVANIVMRFLPVYKQQNDENRVFVFAMGLPIPGLILLGALLWLNPDWFLKLVNEETRGDLLVYLPHLFVMILFFCYNKVFTGISMALIRTVITNLLNEVVIRIILLSGLTLLFFKGLIFDELVIWYTLAYGVVAGILAIDVIRRIQIQSLWVPLRKFKDMFVFGFFSVMDAGITVFIARADVLMIAYFLRADYVGIYTGGFYLGTLVELAHRAITVVAAPLIAQAWSENRMEDVRKLYRQTSLNLTLFGGVVCLLILINVSDVVLIFPKAFQDIQWVVVFIALTKLISVIFSLNGYIISVSPYFRYNFYFNLALVAITFLTNYWLIPLYGINGAALATLVSMILFNGMRFVFLLLRYRMHPFTWNHLLALSILAFSGAIAWFLDPSTFEWGWELQIRALIPQAVQFLWSMTLRSAVAMAIFIPLVLWLKPSREFHEFLLGLLHRVNKLTGRA